MAFFAEMLYRWPVVNFSKEDKMKKIAAVLIVLSLICILCSLSLADVNKSEQAKRKDIVVLMKMMGTNEIGEDIVKSLFSNFRQMAPDVPETVWKDIEKTVDPNEMLEKIIPLYAKHFTHSEIKALVKFYKSDLGKKLVLKTGIITDEAMRLGEEWGYGLGMKTVKVLQQKGLMPNAPPAQQ